MKNTWMAGLLLILSAGVMAQKNAKPQPRIEQMAKEIEPKVIEWRRHFHQFPELSNREKNTAAKIAAHLRSLGIEVKTGVAHTGVVGLLRGDKPGPVIALRADMDALPVIERNDLPFASKEKTIFNDQEVGIMHACGHDTHMAILMGVAEILSTMKKDLKGTVKFIFQPAEEGSPKGEEGGAELMVKEGVLENPKVDVIFGLHISAQTPLGRITYRPGGLMASVNDMRIVVKGRQAHGAAPWASIDPIVVSAQIINNLQTIVSRNRDARHQAVRGYQRLNVEAMRAIRRGGILFTFSCSQVVDRQLFYDTIVSAAIQSGREISVLHHLSQPADHPVSIFHPEGEYLKGLVLYIK